MTNKALWFFISIIVLGYSRSSYFENIDAFVKESLYFSDHIEDDLSLIKTSPRWKYPNADYNTSIDTNGEFLFPESDIPIISLECNKEDVFGYTKGIYVMGMEEWKSRSNQLSWWQYPANYKNKGKEWERRAKISFFEFEEEIPTQNIAIRINGNATRAFPQKSLRLLFQDKTMPNYFFKKDNTKSFKTMLLRNGGNDWDRAFMRDMLTQNLSHELVLETQSGIAVNVFINGEYWGIHYLRPKIDDDYLSVKYNIAKEKISILESPLAVYRGDKGGLEDFKSFLKQVDKVFSSDSIQYARINSQMDLSSFIDYLIVEMFISNTDWPQNNWMIWKDYSNKINNGRWQWILKDTDYGLGFYSSNAANANMLEKVLKEKGVITKLFSVLYQNEIFKEKFHYRFNEILEKEWNENNFMQTVDVYEDQLSKAMIHQIKRWRTHFSIVEWKNEVNEIRKFYNSRLVYLNKQNVIRASK